MNKKPKISEALKAKSENRKKLGLPWWTKGKIPWNKSLTKETDERIRKYGKKESKTSIENFANGKTKIWNKGLTKNTDVRVLAIAEKLTNRFIENKLKSGHWCSIGNNETFILDNIENEIKYKIIRQKQVGRYIVDGYCPETNTVYEVLEKIHYGRLKKDTERIQNISEKLNCNFHFLFDQTCNRSKNRWDYIGESIIALDNVVSPNQKIIFTNYSVNGDRK
jgi:hypothetical protein